MENHHVFLGKNNYKWPFSIAILTQPEGKKFLRYLRMGHDGPLLQWASHFSMALWLQYLVKCQWCSYLVWLTVRGVYSSITNTYISCLFSQHVHIITRIYIYIYIHILQYNYIYIYTVYIIYLYMYTSYIYIYTLIIYSSLELYQCVDTIISASAPGLHHSVGGSIDQHLGSGSLDGFSYQTGSHQSSIVGDFL